LYNKPLTKINKTEIRKPTNNSQIVNSNLPFQQILQEKLDVEELKFSNHALERLKRRNINLSNEQLNKLKSAVAKVASKGARDSLVLVDSVAFVVSVKNKTVITAIDGEQMKENVFTNIDSAVIT
jgi:flagellar operon protein